MYWTVSELKNSHCFHAAQTFPLSHDRYLIILTQFLHVYFEANVWLNLVHSFVWPFDSNCDLNLSKDVIHVDFSQVTSWWHEFIPHMVFIIYLAVTKGSVFQNIAPISSQCKMRALHQANLARNRQETRNPLWQRNSMKKAATQIQRNARQVKEELQVSG